MDCRSAVGSGAKRPVSTPFGIKCRRSAGIPFASNSRSISWLMTTKASTLLSSTGTRVALTLLRCSLAISPSVPPRSTLATTGVPHNRFAAMAVVVGESSSCAWMRLGRRRRSSSSAESVNSSEATGFGPMMGIR